MNIKRNRWTKQEDFALRKLYTLMPNGEIAEFLNGRYGYGRTSEAVGLRARRMGLRKAVKR